MPSHKLTHTHVHGRVHTHAHTRTHTHTHAHTHTHTNTHTRVHTYARTSIRISLWVSRGDPRCSGTRDAKRQCAAPWRPDALSRSTCSDRRGSESHLPPMGAIAMTLKNLQRPGSTGAGGSAPLDPRELPPPARSSSRPLPRPHQRLSQGTLRGQLAGAKGQHHDQLCDHTFIRVGTAQGEAPYVTERIQGQTPPPPPGTGSPEEIEKRGDYPADFPVNKQDILPQY